jgi:hypothetical protein
MFRLAAVLVIYWEAHGRTWPVRSKRAYVSDVIHQWIYSITASGLRPQVVTRPKYQWVEASNFEASLLFQRLTLQRSTFNVQRLRFTSFDLGVLAFSCPIRHWTYWNLTGAPPVTTVTSAITKQKYYADTMDAVNFHYGVLFVPWTRMLVAVQLTTEVVRTS